MLCYVLLCFCYVFDMFLLCCCYVLLCFATCLLCCCYVFYSFRYVLLCFCYVFVMFCYVLLCFAVVLLSFAMLCYAFAMLCYVFVCFPRISQVVLWFQMIPYVFQRCLCVAEASESDSACGFNKHCANLKASACCRLAGGSESVFRPCKGLWKGIIRKS